MISNKKEWSVFQKISFRFIFVYFYLYINPFLISYLPYTESITKFYYDTKRTMVLWIADAVFSLGELTYFPGGSGDTTYNYVQIFMYFVIAIFICVLWSILDRKRKNYHTILRFFRIYVSYYVAAYMFSYGFSKILYLQFSPPSFYRLLEPFGEASPMGIAWAFMGASKTYTMFSGFAELIAGILLLFRRTRTFGGLFVFAVMFNVFMLNMSYDIPVKLFSLHLVIMGLFIAMLDYKRIFNLIALKNPLKIDSVSGPYFKNRKMSLLATLLKATFIVYMSYLFLDSNMSYYKQKYQSPEPMLYGIYDVNTFIINKDTIAPLLTDEIRWKRFLRDKNFPNRIIIKGMNDQNRWYNYELDSIKNTVKIYKRQDTTDVYNLHFIKSDSTLLFKGTWKNDSIQINMDKFDLSKFHLTNREFRWINEYPYNR